MLIEDARDLAAAAVQALRERKAELQLPQLSIDPLPRFLAAARTHQLQRAEKEIICEQAILVVDQFYAHLPFKRARYAVDPVQRLRLLHAQLARNNDDLQFHAELLQVFTEMRDAHTFYGLPSPYRGAIAFLPFFMQSYVDEAGAGPDGPTVDQKPGSASSSGSVVQASSSNGEAAGRRHFVVTNLLTGFEHPYFKPGVEVTYWNGMPVARAVERLAENIPAGNVASKFVRGMMRMTIRSLTFSLPPDEEVVFVQYRPNASEDAAMEERIIALPWTVASGMTGDLFQIRASGICEPLADQAAAREILWGQQKWREQTELQLQEAAEAAARQKLGEAPIFSSLAAVPASLRDDDRLFSKYPNIFEFQHPSGLAIHGSITPDELSDSFELNAKRFGYIRIKSFSARSETIFREFKRILEVMKECGPDGLIIDVRGNPGGSINGAERLLQFLTPKDITPASFHFANTPTIQEILNKASVLDSDDPAELGRILRLKAEFGDWIEDGLEAVASGKLMTDGRPLTSIESANDTGQVYQGPVVLLIDSASYSATDIFAAGFQDHGIGLIIGVDENTGGGGASRWLHHEDLVEKLKVVPGVPLESLPGDAVIGFAILRSSRVGKQAGYPIEDVGVTRDILRRLTKRDLMDWGSDLVKFACSKLAEKPVYRLEIAAAVRQPGGLRLTVRCANLDRLVCFLDGHPQLIVAASEQEFTIPIGDAEQGAQTLTIRGFAWLPSSPIANGKRTLELAAAARLQLTPQA